MIQIKLVTNAIRKTITDDANKTIRAVLEENEINYDTATVYLDGIPLDIGDHDKTFAEYNITDKCLLSAVVKASLAK